MKKLIAIMALMAMLAPTGAALAINTALTQDASGGTAPRVLVSWVARGDQYAPVNYYHDDSGDAGSQILPSGEKDVHTTIAMCAVVESDYGIPYIDNVYADVYYPNVELGASHEELQNQSGDGCGMFMQQDLLIELTKQEGIDLFCTNVQNLNNDLPVWNSPESYTTLCGSTGKLYKEEAVVYCGTKTISYEDPAGDYPITTLAQDQNGQSGIHEYSFEYLPVQAFDVDFSSVSYGPVKLNVNKIVSGDVTFSSMDYDKATIRNTGNVRLAINVYQDDMNLGKTSGNWNVSYGARIGHEVGFTTYSPETTTPISDELDLSETNEMDFSVLVNKFPYPTPTAGFVGTMTLSSSQAAFTVCCPPTGCVD